MDPNVIAVSTATVIAFGIFALILKRTATRYIEALEAVPDLCKQVVRMERWIERTEERMQDYETRLIEAENGRTRRQSRER